MWHVEVRRVVERAVNGLARECLAKQSCHLLLMAFVSFRGFGLGHVSQLRFVEDFAYSFFAECSDV